MKNILPFLLSTLLICVFGHSQETRLDEVEQLEDRVDELVRQYSDLDIFSGVVLISQEGRPVYHKAFGFADRTTKTPNTVDTRFDIGSMNKTMTRVLILQLVNEGKLALDDPLGQYLTGFSNEIGRQVTIRHLLNHTAGFGDYHNEEYWQLQPEEKTIGALVDLIRKQPLMFSPGEDQSYSNAGYVLLGAIIEEVTGKTYLEVVQRRILDVLKMKDTEVQDKRFVDNRAIGYYKNMKGELLSNEEMPEVPTPAGGFYSTAWDVSTFYQNYHYGDRLLNESARKLDDHHSFHSQHYNTGAAIPHAGGFEGANSVHFEILRDKISITVLANMDEPVAEQLGTGILAIIRGHNPREPTLPAIQAVYQAYLQHGIAFVKKNFEKLIVNFHPTDPKDLILNEVGYEFLFDGKLDDALEIFRANLELFPGVPNCYDSYGEALLAKGKLEESAEAYNKALELAPGLPSAIAALKKISQMK